METTVRTEKIVIEINYLTKEKKEVFSEITAREKIVFFNDQVVYKEYSHLTMDGYKEQIGAILEKLEEQVSFWNQTAQFNSVSTIKILEKLEEQLSFWKQSKTTKESRCNTRKFIESIKLIWRQLTFKIINFKF